jgi:hypothetical protein
MNLILIRISGQRFIIRLATVGNVGELVGIAPAQNAFPAQVQSGIEIV